jgi:hypothetical protein
MRRIKPVVKVAALAVAIAGERRLRSKIRQVSGQGLP